jgi:hypothetical protein
MRWMSFKTTARGRGAVGVGNKLVRQHGFLERFSKGKSCDHWDKVDASVWELPIFFDGIVSTLAFALSIYFSSLEF